MKKKVKKKKKFTIDDAEITKLFEKFSYHITRPTIAESQETKALGIAKILWLLLVTGTDSERNVYNFLSKVTDDNYESNVQLGSLYFFKMKKSLTSVEITKLKNHYKSIDNFNKLEEWGISPIALKEFH